MEGRGKKVKIFGWVWFGYLKYGISWKTKGVLCIKSYETKEFFIFSLWKIVSEYALELRFKHRNRRVEKSGPCYESV
jgi:hypothetical protein